MNKIDKVRALLRLAHDQAGLHEGESARQHALQLMKKYGVSASDLGTDAELLDSLTTIDERAQAKDSAPDFATMVIDTELRVPQEDWKRNLMFVVAQHVGLEIRVSTTTLMRADRQAAYERWKQNYRLIEEKITQASQRLSQSYASIFCKEAVSAIQERLPGATDEQLTNMRIDSTGFQPGRTIYLSLF